MVIHITDDKRLASMLGWILSEGGYDVVTMGSADEAIASSKTSSPGLIIFDGALSHAKRTATLELRATYPEARVIGLHQHNHADEPHIAAEGHLHKPFHADDLAELVQFVLEAPVGAESAHVRNGDRH